MISSASIETNNNLLRVVTCHLCTNRGGDLDQLFTLYCLPYSTEQSSTSPSNLLLIPKTNFKNCVHNSLHKLYAECN